MYGHKRPPKQRAADQRSLAEMFQPAKRVSQECRDAATSTSVNCISDDSQSGVAAGEDDDSVQTVSDGVGNMKSGGGSQDVVATTAEVVSDSDHGSFLEAVATAMEGKALSDEDKVKVIARRKPSEQTILPFRKYVDKRRKSGYSERFVQKKWFDQFDWLGYYGKRKEEGLFCLPCVLFPTVYREGSCRGDNFVVRLHRDWKNLIADAAEHESTQYHRNAAAKLMAFLSTDKHPSERIDLMQSQAATERVSANRCILLSVLRCLELAAREGVALRGHRDDLTYDHSPQGNFMAFVKFAIDSGDIVLKDHLECCSRNATYMSKTTQNDLMKLMADDIIQQIVDNVKSSPFFAVLADEVRDVSGWEQLAVSLRYMKDNKAEEKLIKFIACSFGTGSSICAEIRNALRQLGLDETRCRAQAYDGAGAMSGHLNGCQKNFRDHVPRAQYYHCCSHQLNLALTKSCNVSEVHCMLSDLKAVGLFFKYSPNRQRTLEQSVEQENTKRTSAGEKPIRAQKLKLLCETRWVERHTALKDFRDMYFALVHCLQVISGQIIATPTAASKYDAKSVTEANGLLRSITSDSFIVALHCCTYLFGYTKCLSVLLQGSQLDVLEAYGEINQVLGLLEEIRSNSEREFSSIFASASAVTSRVLDQDHPQVPRLAARQTLRSNHPASTPKSYWRRAVFIPFIDSMISELGSRFTDMSHASVQGLPLLPKHCQSLTPHHQAAILKAYAPDLPDDPTFEAEIRRWKRKWEYAGAATLPTSVTETLGAVNEVAYPNIVCILGLLLIIPVTTATVERANSALKLIKTDLRSTMAQDRLNALVLMFVHKDLSVNHERVIDSFAKAYPRRLLFLDPTATTEEAQSQ
ncbi:52 kDa repressor of the inhibitor of the protein kinase-like [Corticium candelabrum]|uniref:52 kDa repressor of the inhibitor of the protein kinase-like n=1 Tax=Corticium candelabrum TaxID=121492 RepID=UPI002E26F975|nr:52 kDa repressor of the inhibitor of the protein kinase-like [Corticium candelabrum]